jgi:hypothetical protein
MPDAHGHLSPVDIAAVHKWLLDKHGGIPFPCPVSGDALWGVNDYVYQNLVYPVSLQVTTSVAPNVWPVIQVACVTCGYTFYLNAALIGLYPKDPSPPSLPPINYGGS